MTTAFFWDEQCFWHSGGNYAFTMPVGGLVQPFASGGLPEDPETKRRLKNLMDVTGLTKHLATQSAPAATEEDLLRVHPHSYLSEFKSTSDSGGGELGMRTPFGQGGYEIAALSSGLAIAAVQSVTTGKAQNAYALSRPPGHHCLPDYPMGFCLFNNIAVALAHARANNTAQRVAVLDWDVHHGNGTEAIFIDDPDTLTISIHQDSNFPMDTGDFAMRGTGAAEGTNLNIPLPPGAGHAAYLETLARLVFPAIRAFQPDLIVVACGYDAALIDPLSRMCATAETFSEMTKKTRALAEDICDGKLVLTHEGGYSEVYVPFCGHATLEALSDSPVTAPDPFAATFKLRQPKAHFDAYVSGLISEMESALAAG